MFGKLGIWSSSRGHAWLGALVLHFLAVFLLSTVKGKLLVSKSFEVVSIELVEIRPETPDEPIEEVELADKSDLPIETPEPIPQPEREAQPQIERESSAPDLSAPEPPTIITVAPPPSVPEPDALEEDEGDDEILPEYVIRRDPFLEVAPSGAARVAASVMCARTNRDTRPAFCPDIDDEDIRFAQLARAQGNFSGYSPRDEILFAGATFDEYALQRGYETFRDRQDRYRAIGSTGGTAIVRQGVGVRRHAEGLKNCTPVRTGISRVGGGTDGLSIELSNGSEVFCD